MATSTTTNEERLHRHDWLYVEAIAAAGVRRVTLTDAFRLTVHGDNNVELHLAYANGATLVTVTEPAWGTGYSIGLSPTIPYSVADAALKEAIRLTLAGKTASPEPKICEYCDKGRTFGDGECPQCGWTGSCSVCGKPMDRDADNPTIHDGACTDEAAAEAEGERQIAAYEDRMLDR